MMSRNWLLTLLPLLLMLGIGLIFLAGIIGQEDGLPSNYIGKTAPALELEVLDSFDPPATADLMKPEIKLVNFWASWCVPCRVEHPHLKRIREMGIPVYGINYKDSDVNALAFLEDLGNPFRKVGSDPKGRVGIDWGIYGLPETFIVNAEGMVVYRLAGPITERVLNSDILPAVGKARSLNGTD